MNWDERLSEIESLFGTHVKRDWKPNIYYIQNLIEEMPNEVEVMIRAIYILHNILVEEVCSDDENDRMASILKKCFHESYQRFSENSEYLFFIGKLLYIAEWYFGIDDDFKQLEEKLAFRMQKKAFEIDPGNKLYQWAYFFSKDEKEKAFELSKELLYNEYITVNWLKTKGFAGK
jgi:hypothetical protein